MKSGTLYAKRVKQIFSQLRKQHPPPEIPPEPSDPIDQLLIALLSYEAPVSEAARAVGALLEAMVDYNEVRVSTNGEIAQVIRPYVPNSMARGDAIRRALNAVYRKEHLVGLDSLHKLGRREARQYLDNLDGVDCSAAASVLLWSLGGHAIPVDARLYQTLRSEDLVEPSATPHDVQAFLERNIGATDAKEFCLLMQEFVAEKAPPSDDSADGQSQRRQPATPSKTPQNTHDRSTSR